jgi:hypothetical protein
MSFSAIAAEFSPKLRPVLTQMSTKKNLGMIGGLLVRNAMFVGDPTDHLARFKIPFTKFPRKSITIKSQRFSVTTG